MDVLFRQFIQLFMKFHLLCFLISELNLSLNGQFDFYYILSSFFLLYFARATA